MATGAQDRRLMQGMRDSMRKCDHDQAATDLCGEAHAAVLGRDPVKCMTFGNFERVPRGTGRPLHVPSGSCNLSHASSSWPSRGTRAPIPNRALTPPPPATPGRRFGVFQSGWINQYAGGRLDISPRAMRVAGQRICEWESVAGSGLGSRCHCSPTPAGAPGSGPWRSPDTGTVESTLSE